MKRRNISGLIIIAFLFLFSGCLNQKNDAQQNVSYIKDSNISGNEITIEMEKNNKELYRTYELYLNGAFVREEKVYGTILKISAMEEGKYEVIVKVKMENGTIYKSSPYNFVIAPSETEKMKVDTIEGIKDINGYVSFNIYAANREDYEIYLKDLSIKFFDDAGKDISSNFILTRGFAPVMIKSQESKKIGINYRNNIELEKVYVEASINGYTEKDRKLVTLASKKTVARVVKQSDVFVNLSANKSLYVVGESIKLTYNVVGIKQGNIRLQYGNTEILKSFYEGQKYETEVIAESGQQTIKVELVDEAIVKEIPITTIRPEEVKVDCVTESKIMINKIFVMKVLLQGNIAEDLIFVDFSKDINLLSLNNGNYALKTNSTSEQSIKVYIVAGNNKVLKKEIIIKAEKEENIKVEKIKYEEDGLNVKIGCILKVVTQNLYRFREIRGDVDFSIKENRSTDYELISQNAVKDINIDFTLEKKNNISMKNIYLIYEEIETGELTQIEIF